MDSLCRYVFIAWLEMSCPFEELVHSLKTAGFLEIGSEIEHNGHPLFNDIPSGSGSGFKVVPCNITIVYKS